MLVRIEVHMDTLCPWCYIQKKSLDEAMKHCQAKHPTMEFEVLYRPFYLYPFLHTTCEKRTLYEKVAGSMHFSTWQSKLQAAGAPYGIAFDITGETGPSRPSHVLLSLALQQKGTGAQDAILSALMRGHFEQGKDISDPEWLVEVASEVAGMEGADVKRALASPDTLQEVDEEAASAKDERGVEAVPCVTMQGRYRVGGYQEVKVFEDLFEKIYREESS